MMACSAFHLPQPMMKRNSRALCALLIILGVIVIDQIVKYLVKTNFSLYE